MKQFQRQRSYRHYFDLNVNIKACLFIRTVIIGIIIITSIPTNSQNIVTNNMSSDNGNGTYTNPIIRADYPDPDIIRVGDDFYMISSSFACMPGIPICHSKDLINWEIIGHAYDSLTFLSSYKMEHEETAYGRACWAPSFKYYKGWFYIGVNLKSDRFVMFKSRKPEGPYTMYPFKEELYDPGLFIDEDGKKYVTHGKNEIRITRLNDEGTEIMTPGDKGTIILRSPDKYKLYFEGCHTYKRNGWYYIFNPAQGYNGVQMVSRSHNLFGPYETHLLIDDDINYANSGVHQGGYVDTPNGESWAFTFQDRDYMGRDIMLYPMRWVDDWPIVGLDPDTTRLTPELRDKISRIQPGKGVVTYRKPYIKEKVETTFPQKSDNFDSRTLQPHWEFSHVPISEKWSLTERSGFLRIYASPAKGYEWARNSLTQKVVGPSSTGTVKMDVRGLKTGDFAGNGIMGSVMLQQGVRLTEDGLKLEIHQSKHISDQIIEQKKLPKDLTYIWLRSNITPRGTIQFSYSIDGINFELFGSETVSGFYGFLGIRYALCCYHHTTNQNSDYFTTDRVNKTETGYADFDSFELKSDSHGNHYDGMQQICFDKYDDKEGMRLFRPIDYMPEQYIGDINNGAWISFFNVHINKPTHEMGIELKARFSDVIIKVHEGSKDGPILGEYKVKATGGKWSNQTFKMNISEGIHKITFTIHGSTEGMKLKNFVFK